MGLFEKDINTINFSPMVLTLEEMGKDTSEIYKVTKLDRKFLTSKKEFIDLPTGIMIFNAVKNVLGQKDPAVFYELGLNVGRLQDLGSILDLGKALGGLEQAIKYLPRFNRKFNDIFEMEVLDVYDNSGIIKIEYKKEKYDGHWIFDQEFWNMGAIAGIPYEWGLPNMEVDLTISRFTLEELFRDYSFMNHKLQINSEKGIIIINGKEMAVPILLKEEKLKKAYHVQDLLNPLTNKKEMVPIFSTNDYEIIDRYNLSDLIGLKIGMLIIEDFKVSDLFSLKKGQIFAKSDCRIYSRLDIKWSNKRRISRKIRDTKLGRLIYMDRILAGFEEEMQENLKKTRKIIKSEEELRVAHEKLKDYAENLEQMVEERTREVKEAYINLELAHNKLKSTQAQLIQSEKLAGLGTLAAGIAHEINNPAVGFKRGTEQLIEAINDYIVTNQRINSLALDSAELSFIKDRGRQYYEKGIQGKKLSTKELRRKTKEMESFLEDKGIEDYKSIAKAFALMEIEEKDMGTILEIKDLNKVDTYTRFLKSQYNIGSIINMMNISANRIINITESLKRYSHLDKSPEGEVDIKQGIEDTLTILENELKYGIQVVKDYQNISKLRCYPAELAQVWTNIIHNAAQAMEGKGTLQIKTYEINDKVGVSITDSGPGIPEGIKDKIFEPFFTTKDQGGGSGLGLGICSEIVKKHKGLINVYSKPGNTRFEVLLPKGG